MSQLAGSLPAFARRSSVTSRHSAAGAGGGVRLNDRSASRTRTSLENVPIPFSDVYGTVRSHATAHGRVGSVTPSAVRVDAMLVRFRRLCQRPYGLITSTPM